jgi:hypothetical protein
VRPAAHHNRIWRAIRRRTAHAAAPPGSGCAPRGDSRLEGSLAWRGVLDTRVYGNIRGIIEEPRWANLMGTDLEAVLDLNVDGIYHARLAGHWAKAAGSKGSNLLGKDADDLSANALFAQAVSSHNLGLNKEARFLSSTVLAKRINTWSGEAALALLKYTAFAQRMSLREVDKLSDQYLEAVETFGSGTDQTTTRLAFSEAKLRAYLACAPIKSSLRKADTALEQCLSETAPGESEENRVFARISQMGVLRSVIFLNTYSQLLRARGDSIRAEKVRTEAESRANRASLTHQLAWIRAGSLATRRFLPTVRSFFEESRTWW